MQEILDALYNVALTGNEPSYWLFDDDLACTYADSIHLAERQREKLRGRLDSTNCELLERYTENLEESSECKQRISFNRGLAIGLALAMLPR